MRRISKASRWGAFFVCVVVIAFAAPAPAQEPAREQVRVQRAHDGDSLRLVDGREVRLIGVNAPEFGKDSVPHQPLAEDARRRTAALTETSHVTLHYETEKADRYGRLLAHVVLADGRDVETLLLREGLAWFVAIAPNTQHVDRYRAAEAEARRRNAGIWARPEYTPTPVERLTLGEAGFRRIVGTVTTVKRVRNNVEITLAPHVRLTIPTATAGVEHARDWIGKELIVRGWLSTYKGKLYMRINHLAMIETL